MEHSCAKCGCKFATIGGLKEHDCRIAIVDYGASFAVLGLMAAGMLTPVDETDKDGKETPNETD